jgi:PKHD-type hydroxylase
MPLLHDADQPLVIQPAGFPPEVCAAILAEAAAAEEVDAALGDPDGRVVRRARVAGLPASGWVGELAFQAVAAANRAGGWHYDLLGVEDLQVVTYGPGDGYGWHADAWGDDGTCRKLSASVQLDDGADYGGGDLVFQPLGVREPVDVVLPDAARRRGAIVVFPSFLLHRVTPVTAGVRRALVVFARGPRFR